MTPLKGKAPSGIHQPCHTYGTTRPEQIKSTNKKYIGTLLSSQTSSPHSHTARFKRNAVLRVKKIFVVRACFPTASLQEPLFLWGAVGRADSYKVTHGPKETQISTSWHIFVHFKVR